MSEPSPDRDWAVATHPYLVVDVFTDCALTGNQLAVFPDGEAVDPALMLPLTREMNFSETVFACRPSPGADAHARIRIFMPGGEIPFGGHPTLGSAIALAGDRPAIRLETGAGIVPVTLEHRPGAASFGWMTQPIPTLEAVEPDRAAAVLRALGVAAARVPVEIYNNGARHLYVVLENEAAVAALAPDMAALGRVCGPTGANCCAGSQKRWTTRMFVPGNGVPEDPATGSAAGPLALHLARHGLAPWGEEITISQGAAVHRPSKLYARVDGEPGSVRRVLVGGAALVVARGEFRLPTGGVSLSR